MFPKQTGCATRTLFLLGKKLQFIGLFAAEGGLGPLVLRGLAKIGAFVPIFDWGSFLFTPSVRIAEHRQF